jgi:ribosome-associated protein
MSLESLDVPIREESIRLGQFLKLADLVDSGADAKGVLAEGLVRVNGEVETRRGRQLVRGDVVEHAGRRVRVAGVPGVRG